MSRYKTYGLGAVSEILPLYDNGNHRVNELRFNLSTNAEATAATTFVVNFIATDSTYNVIVMTQAMVGVADFIWRPDIPFSLGPSETIQMVWTNDAASFKRWGLEVIYDE